MGFRRGAWSGWCAGFALVGFSAGTLALPRAQHVNVLISGDTQGYLSPCGCTSPMTGGIRRLATAVAEYRGPGGVFLVNGGLVQENPPNGLVGLKQSQMKALALADALRAMHADAINVGLDEISTGKGTLAEIEELTDHAALTTSLEPDASNHLPVWIAKGPLLIGGVTPAAESLAAATGGQAVPISIAVRRLVEEAKRRALAPVLLFRGGESEAADIAKSEPGLALIVYKGAGSAPLDAVKIGRTMLVTPGDQTKNLVRLEFDGTAFGDYRVATLTPDYADAPTVSRYYRDYLRKVDAAKLIEQLPRSKTPGFAGSEACMSCHAEAYKVWHDSAHSHALADLERQGHARDPDCLSCHVTGLASTVGFRTRTVTTQLANVTCESCHGPAESHVLSPKSFHLPKLDRENCVSCHTVDNSPNFDFDRFWPKVRHS